MWARMSEPLGSASIRLMTELKDSTIPQLLDEYAVSVLMQNSTASRQRYRKEETNQTSIEQEIIRRLEEATQRLQLLVDE